MVGAYDGVWVGAGEESVVGDQIGAKVEASQTTVVG